MRILIKLILSLISITANAQIKIAVAGGYGNYAMSNLKSFQREIQSGFPTGSQITETFPPYLFFTSSITKEISTEFAFGVSLTYGSTGGRIHYEDYSGEVSGNQLANYISIGTPLNFLLLGGEGKSTNLVLSVKPYLSFSRLSLEFYSRIGDTAEEESLNFQALNMGIEPAFTVERMFKNLGIGISVGYDINMLPGKLYFTETEGAYLQDSDENPIRMNFSGLRVSMSISYTFKT